MRPTLTCVSIRSRGWGLHEIQRRAGGAMDDGIGGAGGPRGGAVRAAGGARAAEMAQAEAVEDILGGAGEGGKGVRSRLEALLAGASGDGCRRSDCERIPVPAGPSARSCRWQAKKRGK
jgi:hypothetical protein